MKTASSLLGMILDLGKEMLIAGAEVWRVEDILQDVCEAYCFKHADLWIISSCLHATVTTWDGRPATEGGRIVASGDPKLHDKVLKLLNR